MKPAIVDKRRVDCQPDVFRTSALINRVPPRNHPDLLGRRAQAVTPGRQADCQPGHIRGTSGAHERENRSETLRTAEISAAGQTSCLEHLPRSGESQHKTRPTGRLTPLPPPDLRLVVAGGRPLHIRCPCVGRGCIRGPSAGRGEGAVEGGAGSGTGLRD